jgi:hypothetical protein
MVLASLSISAVTDDAAIAKSDQTSPVDIYTYDSHTDIVKFISIAGPGNSCGTETV